MADAVDVPELAGEGDIDQKLMDAIIAPKDGKAAPKAPSQQNKPVSPTPPPAQPDQQPQPPADPNEVTPDDLEEEPQAPQEPAQFDENTPIEVMVDGKPQTVTIKQLRDNYSGEAAIESRLQQSTEARKHFMEQATQLYQANQVVAQRLALLDQHLNQFAQPNITDQQWEWMRVNNPQQYLMMRDQQRLALEQQEAIRREAAETQQKQELINSQAKQQYIDDQAQKLFAKVPEMADPNKREALMGNILEALTYYGYTPQDLKDVTDHRVFHALADAAKYRAVIKRKQGGSADMPSSGPVTQTAARRVPARSDQQKQAEVTKRARETGRPDDVAMTLIMSQRSRKTLSG